MQARSAFAAASLAPPEYPHDHLEREITELWGHINAATARFLDLVRDFDEQQGWGYHGCRDCAHWLNWQCGIGIVAAREKVRVANALKVLPEISAAFAAGQVSYSKVRAMTRVARPDNEADLMNIALHGTAAHVEKVVRLYRRVERLEESREAMAAHQQRYLNHYYDDDGTLFIQARLPAEVGALVVKALQVAEEALRAADSPDSPDSGDESADDDSAESCCRGRTPESVLSENETTPAARRADALRWLAEHFLSRPPELNRTSNNADRYQVVVHIDQTLLSETPATSVSPDINRPERCELESGPRLAAETARRLACGSTLVGMVEGADRTPVDVGRRTRSIPPSLQRALKARDGGCQFPGCTHTLYVEGHHVHHWADGGATRLDNLVLLCRFHHRLIHEGGFSVEICRGRKETHANVDASTTGPTTRFLFRRPDGTRIGGAGRFRGIVAGHPDALSTFHREHGPPIDTHTCRSRWGGERLDYHLAVGSLIYKRDQFNRCGQLPTTTG